VQQDKFDEIVLDVIIPTGNALSARYGATWNGGWEIKAYNFYESARTSIRQDMQLDPRLGDHRIDRHKIASALCLALLKAKPLEAKGKNPSAGARMANEQLAILSAIKVVLHFVEHRLQSSPGDWAKLRGKSLVWPAAHDGIYAGHLSKTLFHAIRTHFDAYLVAHIYFLLDSFHLRTCGITSIPPIPGPGEEEENN
jgi:hypothetical protein